VRTFTISELEHLSGIKAHTLRTWELRYGFPQPRRSQGQVRSYSIDQLDTVLQLALLSQNGHRISQLCRLEPALLEPLLNRLPLAADQQKLLINRLLGAMYRMHIDVFEMLLQQAFSTWSLLEVADGIILPFLHKTHLLWKGTRSTEEHLVVTAIRKKMLGSIESLPQPRENEECILLFLPGTKSLDLALLYVCLQLRGAGRRVLYLGNDVSLENVVDVVKGYHPRHIYTYGNGKEKFDLSSLSYLLSKEGCSPLLISASETLEGAEHEGVLYRDLQSAVELLLSTPGDGNAV